MNSTFLSSSGTLLLVRFVMQIPLLFFFWIFLGFVVELEKYDRGQQMKKT